MNHTCFEDKLAQQGLSAHAIRVAMLLTSTLSNAESQEAAIIEFCQNAPESTKWEAARLRWRRFSAIAVANASHAHEIRAAYFYTPRGSPEETCALQKWITIASTPEEILEVYWETRDMSREQNIARNKLISYFENLIESLHSGDA